MAKETAKDSLKNDTGTNEVLYRKYRPRKWSDIKGQEHIVKVLDGSIKMGKVSHAYIFSGTRGTGKTSIARIFARALETSENDIYEIDAASNTGVEDIRLLNESVSTLPFESKYKVYILDEAHMLSKSAWNAFLKTLEEPPSHVIFILATTELGKVPETILSRCQIFSFRKPTLAILKDLANDVSKKEGYTLEAGGADLIATMGDGSFRDTLGILQKVLSYSKDKNISLDEIETVSGAPKALYVNSFIQAILMKNKEGAFTTINEVEEAGVDMKIFLNLVLEKVRYMLLYKNAKVLASKIEKNLSESDFDFIKNTAEFGINSQILLELINSYEMMGKTGLDSLVLEMMVNKVII